MKNGYVGFEVGYPGLGLRVWETRFAEGVQGSGMGYRVSGIQSRVYDKGFSV